MAEGDLKVPEDVVSALMTLRLDRAGFKVFRLTRAAKNALAVHLPGVEITSGGDTESFRRGNMRASLFIPDELLEAHDPPLENDANAPENVLRGMVVVAPDGPANPAFQREILDALLAAKRDLVPPDAGLGAGRRRRKTRRRKTTRRRR
jgi:hypothetical protein